MVRAASARLANFEKSLSVPPKYRDVALPARLVIPTPDGVVPFVGTPSNGFSISATTKNPEAAIAFENYFASLEGQTLWIKTLDSIPSVSGIVSENPVVNDIAKFDIMLESWYNMLVAQAAEGEAPGQVWEEDQTKVWSGGLTAQQLMDELQELEK